MSVIPPAGPSASPPSPEDSGALRPAVNIAAIFIFLISLALFALIYGMAASRGAGAGSPIVIITPTNTPGAAPTATTPFSMWGAPNATPTSHSHGGTNPTATPTKPPPATATLPPLPTATATRKAP